jgi:hypothetical protein
MPGRVLTNLGCVVRRPKDQLGSPVIPGADIRHVRLVLDQNLRTTEIAELQHSGAGIQEQVLRLDVAMAYALRVDVGQGSEKLVYVQLDLEGRHGRLHLIEEPRCSVYGFRDELLHEVQIDLVFLS